jgi:hypothetical protein
MVRNEGKDIPEQFRRPPERSFELLRAVEAMRAAEDAVWDDAVRASTAEAVGVAGEDVGTPIVALEVEPGPWQGFFGPVITRVPEGDAALRLWDGYAAIVSVPGLRELERTRTEDPVMPEPD